MINRFEFKMMLDSLMNTSKSMLEDHPTKELTPMFFVAGHKDGKNVLGAVPVNDLPKDAWPTALRVAVYALNAEAVFMASEAWVALLERGKDDETIQAMRDGDLTPSQHENRQDAVVISGLMKDGHTSTAKTFFKREKGKIVYLPDPSKGREIEMNCRFFDGLWGHRQQTVNDFMKGVKH